MPHTTGRNSLDPFGNGETRLEVLVVRLPEVLSLAICFPLIERVFPSAGWVRQSWPASLQIPVVVSPNSFKVNHLLPFS